MKRPALKILSDRAAYFRWVLLASTEDDVEFQQSAAPCEPDPVLGQRRQHCRAHLQRQVGNVANKPAFRDAWKRAQHCIIPATAIYERDWRSGKAVPTRITRTDGELLGIAGLYERRRALDGRHAFRFTMSTLNADAHPIFKELHRSNLKRPPELQDKRMAAILPRGLYNAWLDAPAEQSMDLMQMFPAERLKAIAKLDCQGFSKSILD